MRRTLLLLAAVALASRADDTFHLEMKKIAEMTGDGEARKGLQAYLGGVLVLRQAMAQAAAKRAEAEGNSAARLRAGSARMFRESGSANLRSGATSVVSKAGATSFLGLALESGAVTSKTDQAAVTFQWNALPLWLLLNGKGPPYDCGRIQWDGKYRGAGICESGAGHFLRGLTGSVSFNVNSKETPSPVLRDIPGAAPIVDGVRVLTNPSNLSAIGLKYALFQREQSPKKQAEALDKMSVELNKKLGETKLLGKLEEAMKKIRMNDDGETFRKSYSEWLGQSVAEGMTVRKDLPRLEAYVQSRIDIMAAQLLTEFLPEVQRDLADLFTEYRNFAGEIAKLEAAQLFRKSLAFDFVHARPTDQPWLNTIRLDISTPLGRKAAENQNGAAASLDFNAAFTLYHEAQTLRGKSVRLRDASASLALNFRLASWGELGSPVLTVAGYYQYMFENGLIQFSSDAFTPNGTRIPLRGPAREVLNTRGSIGLGQVRFEVPLGKDSGLTFPVALSYANRTELIKDPNRSFWQGHIGLSYDLSKLQEALFKRK